jgi:hypothetical protein
MTAQELELAIRAAYGDGLIKLWRKRKTYLHYIAFS